MLAGSAHADNWIFPCNDFCLCNAGFFNERIEPLKIRSLLNLPPFPRVYFGPECIDQR